jgi:protein MAK16
MLIRQRKLKVSGMHTQEEIVSINKRYEKRETKREGKALIAAKLETAIEKELLTRLQKGTYKDIYNLEQTDFEKNLDEEELEHDQFEADQISDED